MSDLSTQTTQNPM